MGSLIWYLASASVELCLVHAETDHLVLGLRGELEGVDVEYPGPRSINRSSQVESCRAIRHRLVHSWEINGKRKLSKNSPLNPEVRKNYQGFLE